MMGGTASLTIYKQSNVPHLPIETISLHLLPFWTLYFTLLVSFLPLWFACKYSSITCKNTLDTMYTCYRTYMPHPQCSLTFGPTLNNITTSICGDLGMWWKTTTSICGDLNMWWKPPQIFVVIWTCGGNCHKNKPLWWKSPHMLFSVWVSYVVYIHWY